MKIRSWGYVAVCLLGAGLTGPTHAQLNDTGRIESIVQKRLTPRLGADHMGYSDSTMKAFRVRVETNADVAQAWRDNQAIADKALAEASAKGFDPRKIAATLEPLILSWRMTGDKRYATRIHDILIALCAQKNWVSDMPLLKRDPVWNSDLGMGFYGEAFGQAYSAIRDTLSPAQRKFLTDGYIRGVVEPVFGDWIDGRTRIHTLDTMGHNWWAHIVFGAGVGLVAVLPDDPRAEAYLRKIDRASVEWWSYGGSEIEAKIANFDANGGYAESINYTDLAVGTYLEFRKAWTEMIAEPPAPAPLLSKALDFFIHNAYPSSDKTLSVNFGDGSITSSGSSSLATAWILGDKRPDYLWYVNLYNPTGKVGDIHLLPRYLVSLPLPSEPGGQGAPPKLPLTALFEGVGWATMRSSWDKDARFLAIRSGQTWNHNHADAGGFIFFDKGQPLLIDSGNSSYATPEYDGYYRQSLAHNVVTFNAKAEPEEDTYLGSQLPGTLSNLLDAAGIRYVFANATGPTSANFARNFRHILWIDDVILIIDDVKAREPGQFEWLLHTAGTAKRRGQILQVANGVATVDVKPLFPQPFPDAGLPTDYPESMRLVEKSGLEDHNPKVSQTYFAFSPAEKTERAKFIIAILPNGTQSIIERLEEKGMIGVRIRRDGLTTDVMFNLKADGSIRHRNATTSMLGWETDAYILAATYSKPGEANRLFVADGSYVRRQGSLLFDSLSKRFLIGAYSPKAVTLTVQGQANADLTVLTAGRSLSVNGQAVRRAVNGATTLINCCQ